MSIKNLLSNITTNSSIGTSGTTNSPIGTYYPNGTISFPHAHGTTYNTMPYYGIDPYITNYDFESKTIDIEKLMKIEEEKRKMLFDLFLNFLNCDNSNSKKIMYNTLDSYNLIIEKKSLDRKVKISNLTNNG